MFKYLFRNLNIEVKKSSCSIKACLLLPLLKATGRSAPFPRGQGAKKALDVEIRCDPVGLVAGIDAITAQMQVEPAFR